MLASALKCDEAVTVDHTASQAMVGDSQPVPITDGRYVNRTSHASGGMGHVFIAHDRSLNRTIAIKELRAKVGPVGRTSLPDTRATRFLREAQITAKLEHPAITPVHELGVRDDGTLYYTMKLVEGATLSESIFTGQTLEERLRYLPNLVSVANAAAYAHSKGVIHRDIKPENIVLGEFGETVLVDWGIAKIDEEDALWMDTETRTPSSSETDAALTLPGSVIGTPAYMPPEQARGKNRELDEGADIYSLGAVLYSILTGERPFSGGTATELLERVARELPVPVRKREPTAPKELISICEKAMSFNRSDRFDSVQALTDELNRYQDGKDVHCYPYPFQEKMIRIVARHRMIASILVSALVLVGTIAGAYSIVLQNTNKALENSRESEHRERLAAERAVDELRIENYSVSIRIAQKQVEEERFDAAERTLLSCPVELRRWEWGYLYQQCHQELLLVTHALSEYGNLGSFYDAQLSPDNRYLFIDRPGTKIKTLTDMTDGRTIWKSETLDGWRSCNTFSQDGSMMSVGQTPSSVALLSVPSGELIQTFHATGTEIFSFVVSPTNSVVAGFTENREGARSVYVWDIVSGKVVQKLNLADTPERKLKEYSTRVPGEWIDNFYVAPGRVLGFSRDGEVLYFSDEAVKSVDVLAGTSETLFDAPWENSLFSFESQKIAIDMGRDGYGFNWALWNIQKRETEGEFRIIPDNSGNLGAGVIANREVILTPSTDGLLFGNSGSNLRKFSFLDQTLSRPVSSNVNGTQWMSMSQDGRYPITATLSDVRIWNSDVEETSSYRHYRREKELFRLRFHQNYRLVYGAVYSNDGKHLFAPDDKGNLAILGLPNYEEEFYWDDHTDPITAVASHESLVFTGSFGGRIVQRELSDASPIRVVDLGENTIVTELAVSSDGATLLYATDNAKGTNDVRLLRVDSFEQQAILWSARNEESVSEARFSPDGKWIILGVNTKQGGYGSYFVVYDAHTLREVKRIEDFGEPVAISYANDGRRVLLSSHGSEPVLFDLIQGKEIWRLKGRIGYFATLHPDGDRFYMYSETHKGMVFSTEDGQELVSIPDCGFPAMWSLDGKTLYTPDEHRSPGGSEYGRSITSFPVDIENASDLSNYQFSLFNK